MKVLDLFSGIGGFSLGLERTGGFETVAFCEIEEFPRRVLAKHWPGVPIYDDVRTLTAARLAADGIGVDVICGGFPCQDISIAGAGAGIEGERSGLWVEYARLVGELRPSVVIVENVSALLSRGLEQVLGALAALGYDAEWHCVPAAALGAPHIRDRVWVVAYPGQECSEPGGEAGNLVGQARARQGDGEEWQRHGNAAFNRGPDLPHADAGYRFGRGCALQMGRLPIPREIADDGYARRAQWGAEPDVGRVAHGVPNRVDCLGALGNAVVPQIPELIGRAILQARAAA